jgi:hypothetical protein
VATRAAALDDGAEGGPPHGFRLRRTALTARKEQNSTGGCRHAVLMWRELGYLFGCAGASAVISASGGFNFQEKTHLKNRTANATTNSVTPAAAMIRKSSSLAGSFMRFCSTWRFYCR